MSDAAPRLSLSHTTIAVRDLESMLAFYCGVLGFEVTNRGTVGNEELAFVSQDPSDHHQIVFISGLPMNEHQIVFADHLAFRTGSLAELRVVGERIAAAGIEDVHSVSHGNAWSLYFNDPEGNGLECFVDTPFHVAQPHLTGLDLSASDDEIEATTRATLEDLPEFKPFDEWRQEFAAKLDDRG